MERVKFLQSNYALCLCCEMTTDLLELASLVVIFECCLKSTQVENQCPLQDKLQLFLYYQIPQVIYHYKLSSDDNLNFNCMSNPEILSLQEIILNRAKQVSSCSWPHGLLGSYGSQTLLPLCIGLLSATHRGFPKEGFCFHVPEHSCSRFSLCWTSPVSLTATRVKLILKQLHCVFHCCRVGRSCWCSLPLLMNIFIHVLFSLVVFLIKFHAWGCSSSLVDFRMQDFNSGCLHFAGSCKNIFEVVSYHLFMFRHTYNYSHQLVYKNSVTVPLYVNELSWHMQSILINNDANDLWVVPDKKHGNTPETLAYYYLFTVTA